MHRPKGHEAKPITHERNHDEIRFLIPGQGHDIYIIRDLVHQVIPVSPEAPSYLSRLGVPVVI